MDQDATWCGVGLGRGDIVLGEDPAPPMERDTAAAPPHFSAQIWHGRPSQ